MDRERIYVFNILSCEELSKLTTSGTSTIYVLRCNCGYEDGKVDEGVTRIFTQNEYDSIKENGYCYIYFGEERPNIEEYR